MANIKLIEETHKYINTETGEEYASVSSILSKFKKPFDKKYWSEKKAKDYGTSVEEVLDQWDGLRDFSCARGKNYHKIMEDYITLNKRDEENITLYESFDHILDRFGDIRCMYAEHIVYNDFYKVAGMADIIIDHGDQFSILDFKTNKKFRFYSPYNEYLLAPVGHLQACEHNTYALQLSLYAYMYEIQSGKKLRAMAINYLNAEKEKWNYIPVQYLKYEVHLLLKSKDK